MITNDINEQIDYREIDESIERKCQIILNKYKDPELFSMMKELLFVFYHSRDGLYVVNANGTTLRVNPAYETLTGICRSQFINRNVVDLEQEGLFYPSVASEVLKTKKSKTIIQEYKNGKTALVTGNPIFDEQGNVIKVVSNIRDVSELMKLYNELMYNRELVNQYSKIVAEMSIMQDIGFIAKSKEMINLCETIRKIAKSESNVLILGESGVGKGLAAKLIASVTNEKNKPFVTVNCSAIPEQLIESELFGYVAGAFTGASSTGKTGLIEAANEGTLFLDEIADLPLHLQSKLLLFIDSKEVMRVGAVKPISVSARIIAATNADLWKMVEAKQFREDLYYRLNVIPITIPPLRKRRTDIIPLSLYFLDKTNKKNKTNKTLSQEAAEVLFSCEWPGNVRQLRNTIEQIVALSSGQEIQVEDLPKEILLNSVERSTDDLKLETVTPFSLQDKIEEEERKWIMYTIQKGESIRETAKLLGVTPSYLYRRMQKYNIVSNAR